MTPDAQAEITRALAVKRAVYDALGFDPAAIYAPRPEGAEDDMSDDDAQAICDTIDGATDIAGVIEALIEAHQDAAMLARAADERAQRIIDRRRRYERRGERLRLALLKAMTAAGRSKFECALATLSVRAGSKSVEYVEGCAGDIPAEFLKPQPPKPDGAAILRALKEGVDVPGCRLKVGEPTVAIRV
ncbi:MAG: siphovirus Gp157 family protein [Hyphomicrobiales bacterium]|nr:siphovirus Gp157 family protein [Hyphomicrobiales bacterium]